MPFEKSNIKHHNQTERDVSEITLLFDEVISQVAMYVSAVELKHKIFKFKWFPYIRKRVDELLQKYAFRVETQIEKGVVKHWELAEVKNDKFFNQWFKEKKINNPLPTRNAEGLNAFRNRKNRKLSKRVWKYTEQLRQELEMAIDTTIKDGIPTNKLATELKKYLKEPNRLHRRYRDNNGQLELSKNAKAYHPGQGVYRSSYKNAERLARTEINRAYRMADIERFASNPYVIGYEIKRSKHPYPCKTCDLMAGQYPKNFIWGGNHPNCRCYLVPIMASDEDFINEALPKQTTTVNPKLTRWIKENSEKIGSFKSVPLFLSENKSIVQDVRVKDLMSRAKASTIELDKLSKEIATKYGGYVTPVNLKSKASILRKLNSELNGDVSQIKDAVRSTIIVPQKNIQNCIDYLQKNDIFVRMKIQKPDRFMGYSGVLSNVKTSHNILGEIQVNTEKMIYAKEPKEVAINIIGKKRWREIRKQTGLEGGLGHKYYEEYRVLDKSIPKELKRMKELEILSSNYYKHFR